MQEIPLQAPQQQPFAALRNTNVSNPSFVVHRPSHQSLTASEDYYSLSGSSSRSGDTIQAGNQTAHPIRRFSTPPSRYRTPQQSRDQLVSQNNAVAAGDEQIDTPLRGQGTRRQSQGSHIGAGAIESGPSAPAAAVLREGGVKRTPVTNPQMDNAASAPHQQQQEFVGYPQARSSIARDIARDGGPPTPDDDDTPYIRFALDQLTRDEEVRGSRRYFAFDDDARAGQRSPLLDPTSDLAEPVDDGQQQQQQRYDTPDRVLQQPATEQWPQPQRGFDEPAVNIRRLDGYEQREPEPERETDPDVADLFLPVSSGSRNETSLDFLPAILRPLAMALFVLLLVVYLGLLLASAILSLLQDGLFPYGDVGDGYYFLCQYLPSLLGVILFLWLVQIEVAVYRIAPFIALCSPSPVKRHEGARLPMYPGTFFLPCLEHCYAGQIIVTIFLVVAWLQIFTVPLLGSSFNVYFYGTPQAGQFRWLATQGTTWAVIALYALLLLSTLTLVFWIRRRDTGLRWDPRSLADVIVLLERSNALEQPSNGDMHHEPGRLGYWRTNRSANAVFHTYGLAKKPARQYALEDGRIREKPAQQTLEPRSHFSDHDMESGQEQRLLRDKTPRHSDGSGPVQTTSVLPWFLQPIFALLWPIVAIVLIVAFLVVSYLPSINILNGFAPDVSAIGSKMGFSPSNFLYSFVPSVLAMICLLGWLDIDYAYRRLQPYTALLQRNGELAERSLLLSYTSDLPGTITLSALANRHIKIAIFSIITLVAAALPVLAGGVFWTEFYVSLQLNRITPQPAAYYALSALLTLYAAGYLLVFPGKHLRNLDRALPAGNQAKRFIDILDLVRGSRILDDVAFHGPRSKPELVTRLMSSVPGASAAAYAQASRTAPTKVSLADRLRGFGAARRHAHEPGAAGAFVVPRYYLGRHDGRDGKSYVGIDRVRE